MTSKDQTPAHRPNFTESDELSNEVLTLQQELLKKEEDISKLQVINYELTL